MIPGQSCGTCDYHSTLDETCRINPPKPFPFPSPQGQMKVIGLFPAIRKDGWCGQWRGSLIQ